jgi:TPR repeat protein
MPAPRHLSALATLVAASALPGGCHRTPAGLDEAQIEAAARPPDAPPVSGPMAAEQTSCNGGDGHACMLLGTAFQNGSTVPKDEARATRLFWKACADGDGGGCGALGNAFAYGFGGTRKDLDIAHKWYGKACDLKDGASCLAIKASH